MYVLKYKGEYYTDVGSNYYTKNINIAKTFGTKDRATGFRDDEIYSLNCDYRKNFCKEDFKIIKVVLKEVK